MRRSVVAGRSLRVSESRRSLSKKMELEVSAMVATILSSAIDSNLRRPADGSSSHSEGQALFATPTDVLE
jgi:hypothetical protein